MDGALAERLRRGLQNLVDGFDSRTCLQSSLFHNHARMVELVDTRDLKSLGRIGRAGSIPALRTTDENHGDHSFMHVMMGDFYFSKWYNKDVRNKEFDT